MVLLFSSSCIQSTTSVIFLSITADGADADGDDANNEDKQHSKRDNGSVSPANWNPGNNGRMIYMRHM